MLPISVCMIMKNEEKHLCRCLDALKDLDCELILVDTGSTDTTIEIAQQYVSVVYSFHWVNDFSAARNYSLSLASNDWVLILDCDETVTALDSEFLLAFMKNHPYSIGLVSRRNHYTLNGTDAVYTDQVERFFDRRYYQYAGKIHEQVVPVISPGSAPLGPPVPLPLSMEHSGYTGSMEELQAKALRNNTLLLEMLSETPHNPYLYFQLGQSFNMLQDDEKAAYYYGKGLEYDVDPAAEFVQMMVIGYGYALLHLERFQEALQFEAIYDAFSGTADFLCLMGLIYLRTGRLLQAMAEFLKAAACPIAHVEGANSFIPYYNMGCVNELSGDAVSALKLYRKCGSFAPALERIAALEKI